MQDGLDLAITLHHVKQIAIYFIPGLIIPLFLELTINLFNIINESVDSSLLDLFINVRAPALALVY